MLLILNLGNFGILGHGERIVDNFIISLTIRADLNEFLSLEVVIFALITNGSLDFPSFDSSVLESYLLSGLFPDHAVKLELLDRIFRLRNAFTNQVDIKWI